MPPTLTDQVFEIRNDLNKVRDELKTEFGDQGRKLESSLEEFKRDFAGFRSRIDLLIDDVPEVRREFDKFQASVRTYLVVAGWAVGVLSFSAIGLIGSAINLSWNASRLHSDVAQHTIQIEKLTTVIDRLERRQQVDAVLHDEQFGKLTMAISKLEVGQKPLEALPGLLKSLESMAKVNEQIPARLGQFENELRPLLARTQEREWSVLITEADRLKDSATPPDRTLEFGLHLLDSAPSPRIDAILEPTFAILPSPISRGIEHVESIVTGDHEARVRVRFKSRSDRELFEGILAKQVDIVLNLKLATGR